MLYGDNTEIVRAPSCINIDWDVVKPISKLIFKHISRPKQFNKFDLFPKDTVSIALSAWSDST